MDEGWAGIGCISEMSVSEGIGVWPGGGDIKAVFPIQQIAQMCHCHGNYNSLKAILAGLQCTPIFRLSRTWKEVGARKRRWVCQCKHVISLLVPRMLYMSG